MKAVNFSGTFIIPTNYNNTSELTRIANPDYIEGYNYKPEGLFAQSRPVLVIRNESIAKDQKVLEWLGTFDPAPWMHYNPVMVTADAAKNLFRKIFS